MATRSLNTVIQHIHRMVPLPDGAEMTDGQLLESFISWKNEAAFAALVSRHGPMVLGVCRRLLPNHHDAEDAFQATFLVLARKAASVRPRDRVANWLHGVAYRTALKARTQSAKRHVRERQVSELPEPAVVPPDTRTDLRDLIDREVSRLPDAYRLPIILCYLEARSIKEATRQLGWPQGTLAGRLARARQLLAKRLTQRGLALTGGSLALARTGQAAPACVPQALAVATFEAAVACALGKVTAGTISAPVAALTEGVANVMMLTKLKAGMLLLIALGVVALGSGSLLRPSAEADEANAGPGVVNPAKQAETPSRTEETAPTVRLGHRTEDYPAIFERVTEILSDYFEIQYANRYDGRIETFPSRVRNQSATGNSMRRRAVVQIIALDEGGFSVNVQVFRERQSAAEAGENRWTTDGHDTKLEQVILRRLSAPTPPEGTVPHTKPRSATAGEESKQAPPPPSSRSQSQQRGTSKTIILDHARIEIDSAANLRIIPVKTGTKHLVRLEMAGVRVEVPRLTIESATEVVQIEASADGQLTTQTRSKAIRVGEILVVGNTKTPKEEILEKLPLYPGQLLAYPDLLAVERNLAEWKVAVSVLDNNEGSDFRDLLVTVEEK